MNPITPPTSSSIEDIPKEVKQQLIANMALAVSEGRALEVVQKLINKSHDSFNAITQEMDKFAENNSKLDALFTKFVDTSHVMKKNFEHNKMSKFMQLINNMFAAQKFPIAGLPTTSQEYLVYAKNASIEIMSTLNKGVSDFEILLPKCFEAIEQNKQYTYCLGVIRHQLIEQGNKEQTLTNIDDTIKWTMKATALLKQHLITTNKVAQDLKEMQVKQTSSHNLLMSTTQENTKDVMQEIFDASKIRKHRQFIIETIGSPKLNK